MATKKTPSKKTPSKTTPRKTVSSTSVSSKTVSSKTVTSKPAARKPAAAAAVAVPASPAAVEPVEAAVAASQETIEAVVKAGTQAASKGYEQAVAMAQEQVEKASSTLFKGYDEVASLGKESVDAYVASTSVLAKGIEAMSKELMGFTQSAVEANVANAKALFGAKTLREVIDLQSDFSRGRIDSLVSESAKLTELSLNLANDTFEPIQVQLNATVEKLMKPLAA